MNLAVNARDAMPRGGALTIETTNVSLDGTSPAPLGAGDYVSLSVADTGLGVDPDVLPHIFEPFFTTKAMGQGTGLGLATVHGIVKQSGGDIVVKTEPGRGTTFTIYLPATLEPLSVEREGVAPETGIATSGRVLLVEDDAAVREFVAESLRSAGWHVVVAPGPFDALSMMGRDDQYRHCRHRRRDAGAVGRRARRPAGTDAPGPARAVHLGLRRCRRDRARSAPAAARAALEAVQRRGAHAPHPWTARGPRDGGPAGGAATIVTRATA